MEIVDELMTPGCPQCAYKHLSAALSYLADQSSGTQQGPDMYNREVLVARAIINLGEVAAGYDSHFEFAIGLMERAENMCIIRRDPDSARKIRDIRVKLTIEGHAGIRDAMNGLMLLLEHPATPLMLAHMSEAAREFKFAEQVATSYEVIQKWLRMLRKEYFDVSEGEPEEGKEVK